MALAGPIQSAVIRSLRAASLPATDEAGERLARGVARLLDEATGTEEEAEVFNDLAPKLLAILNSLGLTPAGRRVKGGKTDDNPAEGRSTLVRLITERGAATRVS